MFHSAPPRPERASVERAPALSALEALLQDIKAVAPSRGEILRAVDEAARGELSAALAERIADRVLALTGAGRRADA